MYSRSFAFIALVFAVLVASPQAQLATMPLDQVRPGMVGVGRTVFSGTKLDDFEVHTAYLHSVRAKPFSMAM